MVGSGVGEGVLGAGVGWALGLLVGRADGRADGLPVGRRVGCPLGEGLVDDDNKKGERGREVETGQQQVRTACDTHKNNFRKRVLV